MSLVRIYLCKPIHVIRFAQPFRLGVGKASVERFWARIQIYQKRVGVKGLGPLIDPLPCHPGKDQNISGHTVLAQNLCVT